MSLDFTSKLQDLLMAGYKLEFNTVGCLDNFCEYCETQYQVVIFKGHRRLFDEDGDTLEEALGRAYERKTVS